MTKLMTTIHDLQTGEIVTREMTVDEIANFENVQAKVAEEKRIELEASTSKAALRHLASILGVELGRSGITVNAIAIGATINDRNLADNPDYASLWGTLSPMGRVGTPQDVAQTVRYLCSDAAQLVNGQTLTIDGGWTLTSPLSAGERQQ